MDKKRRENKRYFMHELVTTTGMSLEIRVSLRRFFVEVEWEGEVFGLGWYTDVMQAYEDSEMVKCALEVVGKKYYFLKWLKGRKWLYRQLGAKVGRGVFYGAIRKAGDMGSGAGGANAYYEKVCWKNKVI
jgi:hypothetical protein